MDFLFITRQNLEPFEENETLERLQSIPDLYNTSTSTIGDRFSASFDHGSDSTIVRLSKDLQQISISGVGPASKKLILMVTKVLEEQHLRLFDMDYSFDVEIDKSTTDEELRTILEDNASDN